MNHISDDARIYFCPEFRGRKSKKQGLKKEKERGKKKEKWKFKIKRLREIAKQGVQSFFDRYVSIVRSEFISRKVLTNRNHKRRVDAAPLVVKFTI